MSSYQIDGEGIPAVATARNQYQIGGLITLRKQDRVNLDAAKHQELFNWMVEKGQMTNFRLLRMLLESIENLQETYDLYVSLASLKSILMRYDMIDVFKIVFPIYLADGTLTGALEHEVVNGIQVAKTKDLFKHYQTLTKEQVARSCEWYRTWTSADYIQENMDLSYEFLHNHMEDDLWGKVLEDINPYLGTPSIGGPLAFHFMMKRIQVNSQVIVDALQNKFKTLRIDQYDGENVS